jgi:hypothetical protein
MSAPGCRRLREKNRSNEIGRRRMQRVEEFFEVASPQDVFYDFCLWEYKPVAPCANKFRSVNLLLHSFDCAKTDSRIYDVIQAIQRGFGIGHTVWGLKHLNGNLFWEFYFYDYRRRDRVRSATRLLEIVRPYLPCDIHVNENLHYFMFSLDITNDLVSGKRDLEEIHMYIGNPGSTVSSGICYSVTSSGTRLENFYFFFDATKEMEDVAAKAICSAHVDDTVIDINRILWPEMRSSQVIVVANKQGNDAVYFSRISVDQLIFFMRRMGYPQDLISFVEQNRSKLDHLLYDAGFDYRMEGKDLAILKSGYYGIF